MENKKSTKEVLIKNINLFAMNVLDKNLISNYNLEKVAGIRNLWWSSGIKTGLCLGIAIFSPKYRMFMVPYAVCSLIKDFVSIMDLNSEEVKLSKKLVNDFIKQHQPEQKQVVTPGNGTIN